MERDPDIIRVAEAMIRTHGARATGQIAARSADDLRQGDFDNGRFWWRVALAIRAIQQGPATGIG
jgi:hypothetical protein